MEFFGGGHNCFERRESWAGLCTVQAFLISTRRWIYWHRSISVKVYRNIHQFKEQTEENMREFSKETFLKISDRSEWDAWVHIFNIWRLLIDHIMQLCFMCAEYKKLNPLQLVPALEIGGTVLADSIAILFVNLPFPSRRPRRNFFLERYVMPWHYSDLKQWSVVWMWGIIHGIFYGILSVPHNTLMDLKNGMCEIQINFF